MKVQYILIFFHFHSHVGDKALLANSEIFSRFIGKRHKKVKQLLMQMMPHLTVIKKSAYKLPLVNITLSICV